VHGLEVDKLSLKWENRRSSKKCFILVWPRNLSHLNEAVRHMVSTWVISDWNVSQQAQFVLLPPPTHTTPKSNSWNSKFLILKIHIWSYTNILFQKIHSLIMFSSHVQFLSVYNINLLTVLKLPSGFVLASPVDIALPNLPSCRFWIINNLEATWVLFVNNVF